MPKRASFICCAIVEPVPPSVRRKGKTWSSTILNIWRGSKPLNLDQRRSPKGRPRSSSPCGKMRRSMGWRSVKAFISHLLEGLELVEALDEKQIGDLLDHGEW